MTPLKLNLLFDELRGPLGTIPRDKLDALEKEVDKLRAERDTLLTAAVIDTTTILRRDEELQMLRAERDKARADAERYRGLCDCAGETWNALLPAQITGRLDESIDAALREGK